MCIIVVKPEGVKPPSIGNLENCFDNNSHGAGYMILRKGAKRVNIRKGFMSYESFLENYQKEKIQKEDIVISHFRISTSGKVDGGNCHPYVITKKKSMLRNTSVNTSRVSVAHNGIISELNGIDKMLNDSQLFARDYLSAPEVYNNLYGSEIIQELIQGYIGSSKLAFLSAKEGLLLIGSFVEEKGVLYSNTTYEEINYYNNYYGSAWDNGGYGTARQRTNKQKNIPSKNAIGKSYEFYNTDEEYVDNWPCDMCMETSPSTRWSYGWTMQICSKCESDLDSWDNLSQIQRDKGLSKEEMQEIEDKTNYIRWDTEKVDVSFNDKGAMGLEIIDRQEDVPYADTFYERNDDSLDGSCCNSNVKFDEGHSNIKRIGPGIHKKKK